MFGSPLGLVLAQRQQAGGTVPAPACTQVYNLFHPTNPVAARLEPLLVPALARVPPVNIPRYQVAAGSRDGNGELN